MTYQPNNDRIVYVVYKPSKSALAAYLDKEEAQRHLEFQPAEHLTIKPEVHDLKAERRRVLERLNPIERLAIDPPEVKVMRGGDEPQPPKRR